MILEVYRVHPSFERLQKYIVTIDNGTTHHSWLIMSPNCNVFLVARNAMLVTMVMVIRIFTAMTTVNVVTVVTTGQLR